MTDNTQIRSIIKKLETLAAEMRLQSLTKEALKVLTIILAGIMTFFVLDLLADFPYLIRLLLFVGGVGYAIYNFIKGPLHKYKKDISAEEVSLIVEDHFPEFRSRLISTLQFDQTLPKGNVSIELIGGMMKQTFSMVKEVSFGSIVDQSWKKETYKKLAITAVVSLVLIIAMPTYFGIYLQRLVAPVNYPTATQITDIEVPEYLIAGEDFSVKVKGSGVLPALGTVILTSEIDELEVDLTKITEEGNYQADFSGIFENAVLNIELNDYESEEIELKIVKRPAISQIEIRVQPPQYTGLKAYVQKSGNAQVPKDSLVTIAVTANKELKGMTLVDKATKEQSVFSQQEGQWLASFTAGSSLSYSLTMLDTKGLASKDIPDFRITVKEDRAPTIRIIAPSSISELSPKGSMKLAAKISDDFGLSSVRVLYHISAGEYEAETQLSDYRIHQEFTDLTDKEFTFDEIWSNRQKDLKENQVLKIRFQAVDSSPAKNSALSEEIIIPIISAAEMRLRLSEEFVDAISPIEDLKLKLNSSNRKTEKLGEQQ
ncbi:MAG: DUF4175 family protein [Lentisphaeraceae bacterium]|nr:DUF4175 family protein [Lentisphaeraceae bacterium]